MMTLGRKQLWQMMYTIPGDSPSEITALGDDVSYAKYLPTQLTRLRQDCAEIGAVAMSTVLDRLSIPGHPVRDVLVRCETIIHAPSGSGERVGPEFV
jgi:GntR family transcriptional regulator of arabinose operon